jgi:hypothetical protein
MSKELTIYRQVTQNPEFTNGLAYIFDKDFDGNSISNVIYDKIQKIYNSVTQSMGKQNFNSMTMKGVYVSKDLRNFEFVLASPFITSRYDRLEIHFNTTEYLIFKEKWTTKKMRGEA